MARRVIDNYDRNLTPRRFASALTARVRAPTYAVTICWLGFCDRANYRCVADQSSLAASQALVLRYR